MNEMSLRSRWIAVLVLAALVLASVVALAASKAAEATFRGSNGSIGFFSNRTTPENPEGDYEIFSMNPDGSTIKQLTHNAALDWEPAVSPDGQRIAFFSDREGNNEIYLMNADGTGQTRLTNNSARDQYPIFSPDGNTIIFQSLRDGNWEIYAMNVDGSGTPTNLTRNPNDDGEPAFSPNGTNIAFVSWRDGLGEIYTMNPDGSNQTRLTHEGLLANYLNYSPDGTKIAFHSARDGDYDIYTVNANGSNLTNLTDSSSATETHPAPSPDGTKIAFESTRDGNQELYTMNWDGSNWTRLTNNPTGDAGPDWQPLPIDETTPPEVSSARPPNDATGVSATANIRATFSEEMREASVMNAFKLFKKGSTAEIAAQVSYDAATYTATLNPTNNLRRGATYKAVVSTVAKDMAGNRLDQDASRAGLQQKVWFFTVDD